MSLYGDAAKGCARNACQLAEEASLLFEHGHIARAYYLAHMSVEESSKALILYAADYGKASKSDLDKVKKLVSNHKKKIEMVVQMAESLDSPYAHLFKEHARDLVDHINTKKNETMYVTIGGEGLSTPENVAKSIDVRVHLELAKALSWYVAASTSEADGKSMQKSS